MERLYRSKSDSRYTGGGLKDKPHCDHCGRPVDVGRDDYTLDEILCVQCAAEARAAEPEDYESAHG